MNSLGWFCHQIPERSFDVGGIHFALCHRCTGIVFGLVLGAAVLLVVRIPEKPYARFARIALIVTIAVNVIDWGVTIIGFWENTVLSRTLAGALFGIVAGYVFARALAVPHQTTKQTLQSDLSFSTHSPT